MTAPVATDALRRLEVLRSQLESFAEVYFGGILPDQRLAVVSALLEVARFLQASDFPPDTVYPIIRPALALAARENNALDVMFSERQRKGRPGASSEDHIRTAILAVFADKWLTLHSQDERPLSLKLSDASRKMRGTWFGQISAGTLKTAREIVRREAKDHVAVEFYDGFSRFFDQIIDRFGPSAFALMVRYINEHPMSRSLGILKTPPVSQSK